MDNLERNWLLGFKPRMVMFHHPCLEDEDAIMVQAVCADRVFLVRYKIAVEHAENEKAVLRWLGV